MDLALKILHELGRWRGETGRPFRGTVHVSVHDARVMDEEARGQQHDGRASKSRVQVGDTFYLWSVKGIAEDIKPGIAYLVNDRGRGMN